MLADQPTYGSTIPTVHSKQEARELLKVSMSTLDKLLKSGDLRSVKAGRRHLIPADAIVEFLKGAK